MIRPSPTQGKAFARRKILAAILIALIVGILGSAFWFLADPNSKSRRAYERGQYELALRVAIDRLLQRPGDEGAALIAARSLIKMSQPARAELYFRRAGKHLSPDDLQDRAYGFVQAGDAEGASTLYHELLSVRPEDPLALKRMAAIEMSRQNWPEVQRLADRLVKTPTGRIAGETLSGIASHVKRRYREAVIRFERVLELDPDLNEMPLPQPRFWSDLALDLMADGRSDEARTYLLRAIRRAETAELTELLGLSYYQQGSIDEAERCWKRAVELDPQQRDALLELGRLALGRRQWADAIAHFDRVETLDPDSAEAAYGLAQAHRQLGHDEESRRYQDRSAQLRRLASKPRTNQGVTRSDISP